MNINTSWIVGGLVLLLALAGGLFWLSGPSTPPQAAEAKVATKEALPAAAETQPAACVEKGTFEVEADDFVVGDAKAPITLVEFFSQTCSHCAAFRTETFPKLYETYIKKGVVRLVLRDFQRNQVDIAASVVGRCLGREGFVKFTDTLLERQAEWLERPDQDIRLGLKEMAKSAGLADKDFEACMKQEDQAKQLLAKSIKAQKDYCIEGTPTLLLNGKKIENATTFDELDAYVQAEIKANAPAAAPTKATP